MFQTTINRQQLKFHDLQTKDRPSVTLNGRDHSSSDKLSTLSISTTNISSSNEYANSAGAALESGLLQSPPLSTMKRETSSSSCCADAATDDNGEMIIVKRKDIAEKDILCGRDRLSFNHIGNKNFRVFIDKYRERYQKTFLKENKTKMIIEIVQEITNNGCRFLKRRDDNTTKNNNEDDSDWFVINDQCSHEKVSHALRSVKSRKKSGSIYNGKVLPHKKGQTVKLSLNNEQQKYFQQLFQFQRMVFDRYVEEQKLNDENYLS